MGMITVINPFEVPQGREDETLSIWETADDFQSALNNPELMEVAKGLPSDIPHFPGLYEVTRT